MKKITVNKTRILIAAAVLAAIFSLAGLQQSRPGVPQPAETSRSEEATPETARRTPPPPRARYAGAGACVDRAHQRDAGPGGRHPEPRDDLDPARHRPAGGRRGQDRPLDLLRRERRHH